MEQSEAMECGSRKASPDVLKPRNIYIISVNNCSVNYKQKGEIVPLHANKGMLKWRYNSTHSSSSH
jgi:hypothetical protein